MVLIQSAFGKCKCSVSLSYHIAKPRLFIHCNNSRRKLVARQFSPSVKFVARSDGLNFVQLILSYTIELSAQRYLNFMLKISNIDSMLCYFRIAAVMLPAPCFAFCCSFFIFICEITFFANIILCLGFANSFYHSNSSSIFLSNYLHHLHLFFMDSEVAYIDSNINVIANNTIGVLY